MPSNKVRVEIPKNPALLLALSERIFAKHNEMALTSPLNSMQNHKWEANGPLIVTAITLHQTAEDLQRQTDLAYRKRDMILAELSESVKSTRDLLLGVFRDNPKELNQWGFDVSDTARAAKKA